MREREREGADAEGARERGCAGAHEERRCVGGCTGSGCGREGGEVGKDGANPDGSGCGGGAGERASMDDAEGEHTRRREGARMEWTGEVRKS